MNLIVYDEDTGEIIREITGPSIDPDRHVLSEGESMIVRETNQRAGSGMMVQDGGVVPDPDSTPRISLSERVSALEDVI